MVNIVGTIGNLLGFSLEKTVKGVADLAGRFITTDKDRHAFSLEMRRILSKEKGELESSLRAEMNAKKDIIVAELQQGDKVTKWARPSIVYMGLLFIMLDHVIFPWMAVFSQMPVPNIHLPTDFWVAWGGICATWSIGRSSERIGINNAMTRIITGSKKPSSDF